MKMLNEIKNIDGWLIQERQNSYTTGVKNTKLDLVLKTKESDLRVPLDAEIVKGPKLEQFSRTETLYGIDKTTKEKVEVGTSIVSKYIFDANQKCIVDTFKCKIKGIETLLPVLKPADGKPEDHLFAVAMDVDGSIPSNEIIIDIKLSEGIKVVKDYVPSSRLCMAMVVTTGCVMKLNDFPTITVVVGNIKTNKTRLVKYILNPMSQINKETTDFEPYMVESPTGEMVHTAVKTKYITFNDYKIVPVKKSAKKHTNHKKDSIPGGKGSNYPNETRVKMDKPNLQNTNNKPNKK